MWLRITGILILLALIAGAFYWAYNSGLTKGTAKSEIAVAEYKSKVEELNRRLAQRSAQINERVITNYVTRRETITEVVYRNRDVIRDVVPEQHQLSEGWVYAHDQSVRILPIDFTLASRDNPSDTTDTEALEIVAENYEIAEKNAEQLRQLQEWIRQQTAARDEVNSDR